MKQRRTSVNILIITNGHGIVHGIITIKEVRICASINITEAPEVKKHTEFVVLGWDIRVVMLPNDIRIFKMSCDRYQFMGNTIDGQRNQSLG